VLAAAQRGSGPWARLCERLIQGGLVVPPRDLAVMHRGMVEAGIARNFGDATAPAGTGGAAPAARFATLVDRIRQLLESR
ncbi:MAG: hypothetical protein ACFB13_23420, partial [Kiloniellaceae bacterium]